MNIVVCLKHIINERLSQFDSTYSNLNPHDRIAIESALKLKDVRNDIHTYALSMGEGAAVYTLREAIAYGLDEAFLITDKVLGGSDTMVTSYVLSKMIRNLEDVKLIICGTESLDGSTGQVGPSVAAHLGIPIVTGVNKILCINDNFIICERIADNMCQQWKISLPAVITVIQDGQYPIRLKTISGILKSAKCNIKKFGIKDLKLSPIECGINGSETIVRSTETIKKEIKKKVEKLCDASIKDVIELIR